jgi:AcrR family transcriptional regulator
MTDDVRRSPRADSQRNRARLLEVASRMFSEQGADVPFAEIAQAAGVGVGTIYRHFPERKDLIEAAYRSEVDAVCDAVGTLLAETSPERALRTWMDRFIEYMTRKRGMSDALRVVVSSGSDPFARSRKRLVEAVATLLEATEAAGVTTPGIDPDDLLLMLSGIALVGEGTQGPDQLSRMLDLLFAAVSVGR